MSRRNLVVLLALLAAAAAIIFAIASGALDLGAAARWLAQVGDRWWAPLAFIGLYTIFNVILAFIGTIPGIFIFTYLASSLFAGLVSPREAFLRVLVAGLLLGGLALVSRLFAGKVRKRIAE